MATIVFKNFTFEAAHSLPQLPPDHKCHHLHGHSYKVTVEVGGKVNPATGFVVDYADISRAWALLYAQLDHKFLNDVPGLTPSTSEQLAEWIYRRMKPSLPGVVRVTVNETATAGATFCDDE